MARFVSSHKSVKPQKKRAIKNTGKKRVKPKFGTSKLEQDFARDFLDKLGVEYQWQFEAKDIGRFYDYYLPKHNLLIEIDGSYWHGDPRTLKEGKLNYIQRHNQRVDSYKDKWALMHGIPIMRIWEKDIRENPAKVMKDLKERLYIQEEIEKNKDNMRKRHKNKLE